MTVASADAPAVILVSDVTDCIGMEDDDIPAPPDVAPMSSIMHALAASMRVAASAPRVSMIIDCLQIVPAARADYASR